MGKKVLLNTNWKTNVANDYLISYDIAFIKKFRSLLHITGISAHKTGHWPNYTHGSITNKSGWYCSCSVHFCAHIFNFDGQKLQTEQLSKECISAYNMETNGRMGSHYCLQKHIPYGNILPWISTQTSCFYSWGRTLSIHYKHWVCLIQRSFNMSEKKSSFMNRWTYPRSQHRQSQMHDTMNSVKPKPIKS